MKFTNKTVKISPQYGENAIQLLTIDLVQYSAVTVRVKSGLTTIENAVVKLKGAVDVLSGEQTNKLGELLLKWEPCSACNVSVEVSAAGYQT